MSKEYTTGFRARRCPECEINWLEGGEIRVYDPDTGEDRLIKCIPAEEHPQNGCDRAPKEVLADASTLYATYWGDVGYDGDGREWRLFRLTGENENE